MSASTTLPCFCAGSRPSIRHQHRCISMAPPQRQGPPPFNPIILPTSAREFMMSRAKIVLPGLDPIPMRTSTQYVTGPLGVNDMVASNQGVTRWSIRATVLHDVATGFRHFHLGEAPSRRMLFVRLFSSEIGRTLIIPILSTRLRRYRRHVKAATANSRSRSRYQGSCEIVACALGIRVIEMARDRPSRGPSGLCAFRTIVGAAGSGYQW